LNLNFDERLADAYSSWTQKARIMTEAWLAKNVFCPSCGHTALTPHGNNRPVADFFCSCCGEEFELKSQSGRLGRKIADGAYKTMVSRITSDTNPNFFLLRYNRQDLIVFDLDVIPKHFFTPRIIECRKPLSPTARRAGWTGCNILIDQIPSSGRISVIKSGAVLTESDVRSAWKKTLFLRDHRDKDSRGWLLIVIRCIERLGKPTFTLSELYSCAAEIKEVYPRNMNIHAKIRQQLQILRDRSYLIFCGGGNYELSATRDFFSCETHRRRSF
jgi:type II restriction enzyme